MNPSLNELDPRILELLAGRELSDLSPEEAAELESELERSGVSAPEELLGQLILMTDATGSNEEMPEALRDSVTRSGHAAIAAGADSVAGSIGPRRSLALWIALAASIVVVAGGGLYLSSTVQQHQNQEQSLRSQIATLEERVQSNDTLLADARASVDRLRTSLASSQNELTEAERALIAAAEQEQRYAEQLAAVTSDLSEAQLTIARYEQPVDPAVLAASRQKLLDVPDTIRIDWVPFDLAEAPAEQKGEVAGDVVWNDDLQTGYLRFVGLRANDPATEQYQVWVIDDRGMEQKVSGGVFNATAQGEVIVPIEPGIDVGRVALFAITIEEPGGTWVPSLDRRVVVAPRES